MPGKTMAETIFSAHAGADLVAGDWCVASLDLISGTDTKSPKAVDMFLDLGMPLADPGRVAFGMDHYVPAAHPSRTNNQNKLRRFAEKRGIRHFQPGDGVTLQLFLDRGLALPGMLAGMAESHAASLGAVNACSVALGEAELAAAMATGKLWFRVPQSIQVVITGQTAPGVFAKDLALWLMGRIKAEGASYQVLEFAGPGLEQLSMSERVTLCNMVSDIGAKTAIMPCDQRTRDYVACTAPGAAYSEAVADPDARYASTLVLDAAAVEPLLSCPHAVDNVAPVRQAAGTAIHQAVLGSCTNGRLDDLQVAASVLRGKRIPAGVRFFVCPASREIELAAMEDGTLPDLLRAGAILLPPSCGPCTGFTQQGVPADGEVVISSANRNFKGRLGNATASIYLASPATVAVSALKGKITDPRPHFAGGEA